MKKQSMLIAIFCLCLLLCCTGCGVEARPSENAGQMPADSRTDDPTEDSSAFLKLEAKYQQDTDAELLRKAVESGIFDNWEFSSDSSDYSVAGLVRLSEKCEPLCALLSRPSAMKSFRECGPDLIAEYYAQEEFRGGAIGLYDVIYRVLCPDMKPPEGLLNAEN